MMSLMVGAMEMTSNKSLDIECSDQFDWHITDDKLESFQEISKQCVMQNNNWLVSLHWEFPLGSGYMNGCLVEVSLMSGGHPQFCYHVPKACTKTLSLQVALPPLLNGNSYYFRLFGNGRQKRFNFEFDPIKVSEDDCRDKCRHLKPTDCLCNKSSPENVISEMNVYYSSCDLCVSLCLCLRQPVESHNLILDHWKTGSDDNCVATWSSSKSLSDGGHALSWPLVEKKCDECTGNGNCTLKPGSMVQLGVCIVDPSGYCSVMNEAQLTIPVASDCNVPGSSKETSKNFLQTRGQPIVDIEDLDGACMSIWLATPYCLSIL
jgi:hypothetical protein